MKFLILLAYYKRPEMVKNALESINELENQNFELVFIDDSGDDSAKKIYDEFLLPKVKNKSTYWPLLQDDETKKIQGGSTHGWAMNEMVKQSNSDITIILCDDDAIFPTYLDDLEEFYTKNLEINWGYCWVKYYDPSAQNYKEAKEHPEYYHPGSTYTLNMYDTPIHPFCKIDASQVTFRSKVVKEDGVEFPYPQTRGLDAALFTQMFNKYGLCHPVKCFGQYKGAFPDQMGNRGENFKINVK